MQNKIRLFGLKVMAIAVLTLLVLAVSLPFVVQVKRVQANTNDGGDVATTTKTVYLFSDVADAEVTERINYYVELLDGVGEQHDFTPEIIWWGDMFVGFGLDENVFPTRFKDFYDLISANMEQFGDSYVIFEMTQGMRETKLIDEGTKENFFNGLESFFEGLQNVNAKVMFVCDTDESRFDDHKTILDYVDVHVNTDLDTVFLDSFLRRTEAEMDDGVIDNAVIFLDEHYSQSYYLNDYLIPYLLMRHYAFVDLDTATTQSLENYFTALYNEAKLKFVGMTATGYYYDFRDFDVTYSQISENFVDLFKIHVNGSLQIASNIYALGATESSNWDIWASNMITVRSAVGTFPLYLNVSDYPADLLSTLEGIESQPEVYTLGRGTWTYEDTYEDIIADFLTDGDLTVYDVWVGRCDVTYKPILTNAGGWIYIPCRVLEEWQY